MIKLLKGDDATHVVEIDLPEAAYADGVQIEFALGDLVVLMPSTPRVALTFPASWTRLQPCGRQLGSFTLISPTGERATVTKTYPVYITDDVTAVGAAGSVSGSVIPAIDFSGIETLDASSTPGDTKAVLNEILRRLKALCITLAVVFTAPLVALAAAVTWAPLDTIPGNAPVVTNVSLAGFATTNAVSTVTSRLNAAEDAALLSVYYPEGNVTNTTQITTEGLEYATGEDANGKYAYITSGTSATGDIVIPWKIALNDEEYVVARIAPKAFMGNTNITSVIAPTTLVGRPKEVGVVTQHAVGSKAFYKCSALETISFPGVIAGGICYEEAFAHCTSLTSISMPRCMGIIGGYAFSYCSSLETVELPVMEHIGYGTFEGCEALKNVSFPKAECSGSCVFLNCTNLTSITFPASFTRFEDTTDIFAGCKSLSTVDFSRCTQIVKCEGGVYTFAGVPKTCKFIIPLGMYDEWIAADGWKDLYAAGYKFVGYADAAHTLALQSRLDAVSAVADDALLAAENNEVAVAALDTKVEGTLSFVYGDDVNLVITNYFGTRDLPRLQIRQNMSDGGTNYWRIVWDEMSRWIAFNSGYEAFTNSVIDELSFKADRAFGYYDSHTGGVAPDDFLSISAKNILLGGGGSFQKVVTSGGDFFIATSSDPTVYSATTNGFFKLMDGDGTPLFEYVRGDKTLAWGKADSLTTRVVDGLTHAYVSYPIEATEHPMMEVSTSLEGGGTWIAEDDTSCPINVVWSGSSGNWQADVYSKTTFHPTLFIKASYYEGGDSYIKPTVAQGLNKVVIDGTTYTVKVVEINGTKVLALE